MTDLKEQLTTLGTQYGNDIAESISKQLFTALERGMPNQSFVLVKKTLIQISSNEAAINNYRQLQLKTTDPNMFNYYAIEIDKLVQNNIQLMSHLASNSDLIKTLADSHAFTKESVTQAVTDLINKSGGWRNSFIDNSILKYLEDLNTWASNLNYTEGVALLNISGIILLLLSIWQIIIIFYGTILLDYFDLENRYPKIANLIKLRRKFQQYYLLLNVFIIVITSLSMMYFNLTLINWL